MDDGARQCEIPLAELIDRLAIDQIKEVRAVKGHQSFAEEIRRLVHDIDEITIDKGVKVTARLIRLIVVLAQINLQIWNVKEQMTNDSGSHDNAMKLSHQLNGIRNRIKNMIMDEAGLADIGKTNVGTDGLAGWKISL